MRENEAKSFIQGKLDCMNMCDFFNCKDTAECDDCNYCYSQGTFGEQKQAFKMAIQALEEIQQYRAIGTVEELKAIRQWKTDVMEGFCRYDASSFEEIVVNARAKAIDEFKRRLYGCEGNDVLRMMIPYENVCKIAEQMKVGDEE